jgi:hypothetical protein
MLRTLDSTQIGMKSAKNSPNVPLALPGHARSSVNAPNRDPRVLYHNRKARSCAVTVMPALHETESKLCAVRVVQNQFPVTYLDLHSC